MNTQTSSKQLWAGRIISTLMVLFMLVDGIMKLFLPAPVREADRVLGYPDSTTVGIGITMLVCGLLYIIPRTAVLGAILVTGYLGGAVASNVRVDRGLFDTLFPVMFGILTWLGLWLRNDKLRSIAPLTND